MKIINIGSLNLDYVYHVDHFVRAGETIASSEMQVFPGGKGLNQSVALARAGASVVHAGKIGEDGVLLKTTLADAGADVGLIEIGKGASGHAIIQVDKSGQNCILLYGGANHQIDRPFAEHALSVCEAGDILLIQNEVSNLSVMMDLAHQKKLRVAMNPSPFEDHLLNLPLGYVTWFILNEIEGAAISGETNPEDIASKILEKYPKSAVVLTLGGQGVLYADAQGRFRHGVYDVPVVDTTAAGDTFTGYFLACMEKSLSIEAALKYASRASALAVSKKGASPSIPYWDEVNGANHLCLKSPL